MASNIIFAAQTAILSKLPQGDNSMQSAVLSAVLVTCIGLATSYGQTAVNWIYDNVCQYLQQSTSKSDDATHHTLCIPEFVKDTYGEQNLNEYYKSFGWFITNREPIKKGALKATFFGSRQVFPEDNHTFSLMWNDKEINYKYESLTEKTGENQSVTKRDIKLSFVGQDATVLVDLIDHTLELQRKSVTDREWCQTVFYPCRLLNGCLRWNAGHLTHNKKTWSTVVLEPELKDRLVKDIDSFMTSREWYESMGVSWARGLLLYGEPGCGKTSIIKALSYVHKLNLYYLPLNEVDTDTELRYLFETIPEKAVLVLEDVDAMGKDIVKKRSSAHQCDKKDISDGKSKLFTNVYEHKTVTLSMLLNLIDGIAGVHGRITVLTTNHPEKIDPALLRPGRCDLKIKVKDCDEEGIRELYKSYFNHDMPLSQLLRIKDYKYTPADVTSIFLTNRLDPEAAIDFLVDIRKACAECLENQQDPKEGFMLFP